MARIGFIGASGLMGHGIAKNLQLKGHELAFTVHRNREAVADLLANGALFSPERTSNSRLRFNAAYSTAPELVRFLTDSVRAAA